MLRVGRGNFDLHNISALALDLIEGGCWEENRIDGEGRWTTREREIDVDGPRKKFIGVPEESLLRYIITFRHTLLFPVGPGLVLG
jgi:hypothetical protein